MKTMVIGILVVVRYGLGTEIGDVLVTDGFSFTTENQKTDAIETVGRRLCGMLAHQEGYADDSGKLLQDLMEFEEVTIHDEKNSALYRLKIHSISLTSSN
jgi:hypothetical protein